MSDIGSKLDEWAARGLISAEQADSIRSFEEGTPSRSARGRISLAGEALGYFGAALLVGAFLVGLGGVWDELGTAARVGVLVLSTFLLLIAGMPLRKNREPALERLTGFLWFAAAATWSGAAFILADELLEAGSRTRTLIVTGVATAVFAHPLWRIRCKALQQIAVVGGVLLALFAAGFSDHGMDGETVAGLLVAGFGLTWLLSAYKGLIAPLRTAEASGCLAALTGMQTLGFDEAVWMLIALLGAAVMLAWGVIQDRKIPLGLGAAGLFLFVPQFITETFGASVGAAGSIAIAGALIIGAAVFVGRVRSSG